MSLTSRLLGTVLCGVQVVACRTPPRVVCAASSAWATWLSTRCDDMLSSAEAAAVPEQAQLRPLTLLPATDTPPAPPKHSPAPCWRCSTRTACCPPSCLPACLQVTGNCACPAGKYATAATATDPPQCVDCPKGSWCAGSDYYLPSNDLNPLKTDYPGTTAPRAQQCPVTASGNMTTNGRRATSIRACGGC